MPREPPTSPVIIHGRRIPSGDAVRSLSLPKNGLATIASRAPVPATSARLPGARPIPTSESTFNAKVTSKGARNSRLVLIYASVYSEMKPHPTRCAAFGGSGSSAASAAFRSFTWTLAGAAISRPGLAARCAPPQSKAAGRKSISVTQVTSITSCSRRYVGGAGETMDLPRRSQLASAPVRWQAGIAPIRPCASAPRQCRLSARDFIHRLRPARASFFDDRPTHAGQLAGSAKGS